MSFHLVLSFIATLICMGLACFVFLKQRHSFTHKMFACGMVALAMEAIFNGLTFMVYLPWEVAFWQRLRLVATGFIPLFWLLFSLSFGRDTYQEILSKRKGYVLPLTLAPIILSTFFNASLFKGLPILDQFSSWSISLGWAGYGFHLVLLLNIVLILINLERTIRNSSGSIRWQIKFMILGLGGIFALRVYTTSQVLLFNSLEMALEVLNLGTLIPASLLITWSLFRLRLLKVDIYLSPSAIYNSITVLVVGIYLIVVGILAKLITYFEISLPFVVEAFFVFLALLGITLILMSGKFRERVKRVITLHFKRPKYDYQTIWKSFTHRTASLIGIKEICSAVARMVSETFDVPCVAIWVIDETQENLVLGGSTVFSEGEITSSMMDKRAKAAFLKAMQAQEAVIDFEKSGKDWVEDLKRSYFEYFRDARIRYAVSLLSGNEFLGIMTLHEKLTQEEFSLEDLDLLKTIADQAAGTLLNIRMSEQLSKAKEMEAFQTMSTLFVHDLKNLASKLSLTMQNLPLHFDNPEFRMDAFRAISDSVAKINAMCGSLSLLRQKIVLHPVETDLNELIRHTLHSLNGCKASITQELRPLPKAFIDPEQIQKVIMNLVLNANEALENGGQIRVITEQTYHWIVLSVSDNGPGMSKEFMETSLFKPFKTTKKKGMGVGLYHCKMIVEAHKGRIEVESEQGKGTTFRVFLPLIVK